MWATRAWYIDRTFLNWCCVPGWAQNCRAISDVGGLHAINCSQMTSFSSDSLQASGPWSEVRNSSSLRKILFSPLDWIGLALFLTDVPLLEQLEFANSVVVQGLNVLFLSTSGSIMNTGLSEIDGKTTTIQSYSYHLSLPLVVRLYTSVMPVFSLTLE